MRSRTTLAATVLGAGGGAVLIVAALDGSAARLRFVSYPQAEVSGVRNVHSYRGAPLCQACHPRFDRGLVDDPNRLCSRCHTFHRSNHPVGVVQRTPPPPVGLPLGAGDQVVCHSCHDPHAAAPDREGRAAGRPGQLWRRFNELCAACHVKGHNQGGKGRP